MLKHRRWQGLILLTVGIITLFHILPTLLYYTKPLEQSLTAKDAEKIALSALERVNQLESDSLAWIDSFAHLVGAKISKATIDPNNAQLITIKCPTLADADKIRENLPKAGALIPFYPAQLSLSTATYEEDTTTVLVQRKIPIHFNLKNATEFFTFGSYLDENQAPTEAYQNLAKEQLSGLVTSLCTLPENGLLAQALIENPVAEESRDFAYALSRNILNYIELFGDKSQSVDRLILSLTGALKTSRNVTLQSLQEKFLAAKDSMKQQRLQIQELVEKEETSLTHKEELLATSKLLQESEESILKTVQFLKANTMRSIATQKAPDLYDTAFSFGSAPTSLIKLGKNSLFFSSIELDWEKGSLLLIPHDDLTALLKKPEKQQKAENLLFQEIARLSRELHTSLLPTQQGFTMALKESENATSFLKFNLAPLCESSISQLSQLINKSWNPEHKDLSRENYPIMSYDQFLSLKEENQRLSLVLFSPDLHKSAPAGFSHGSLYIIAKDFREIAEMLQNAPYSPQARQFSRDFENLRALLADHGFTIHAGNSFPFSREFAKDIIFEAKDFYLPILQATRENFVVKGQSHSALLELGNHKERIQTINKIESAEHSELLKWKDDYLTASFSNAERVNLEVPKPTKNSYFDNLILSAKKYLRGDEKRILQWGLDISGGKTVQLELRDTNHKPVTGDEDIRTGINELYTRLNKMGVSEVAIRQEGTHISIDFPGAQHFSAQELIKASSMSFHVVNEKFSLYNRNLAEHVNRFLQEVWNEALAKNKTSSEDIEMIAWKHLHNESSHSPKTEAAKALFDQGLRLVHPESSSLEHNLNTVESKIAMYRGTDYKEWQGQTHPLLIVFKNSTLEGSHLENVRVNYEAMKGNYLTFDVKKSFFTSEGKVFSPRANLSDWTSQFAKDSLSGDNASYTGGRGWRMAVVLNGFVVSSPSLESTLQDHAMISGHFTLREIQKLESDLKAGSLTYTPHILSEKNISPELGLKERVQGITATTVALLAVILTMTVYYRFSGFVASIAVLANLLIMWACLQNLGAALTLPGIAGIILTVGMAVDANVLVFERIREELSEGKSLKVAIHEGYKRAFAAIVDSNITTVLAALILLSFDAGPVKGFALTLIIGIASSMFTALFVTRYIFDSSLSMGWIKTLKMMHWIKASSFAFIQKTKGFAFVSAGIILIGLSALIYHRHHALGLDFTGGQAVTLELKDTKSAVKATLSDALTKSGIPSHYFQIRELGSSGQARLFLSKNAQKFMNELDLKAPSSATSYLWETDPNLSSLVKLLKSQDVELSSSSLQNLHMSWTQVSGQMSETMRTNAFIALFAALLCILLYITFRFEFKYAISATLGLAFDIIMTLAIMGILLALGVPIQIDMNAIAAFLTIIGYSLNDTIIVFDRIREDIRSAKNISFAALVNRSLNKTLSRTIMTSFTTFIVLLVLVLFGGETVFGFSLIMALGVVVGTLSTFFVASPLLLLFDKKEKRSEISATNNG